MVFTAKVPPYKETFRLLIDTGATSNFAAKSALDRDAAAYAGLTRIDDTSSMSARLANGDTVNVEERLRVRLQFLDFNCVEELYVIDMTPKFDIILGMPWLRKHQPWIDWKSGEIGTTSHPDLTWKSIHALYTAQDAATLREKKDAIVDHLSSNPTSEGQARIPPFDVSSASKNIAVVPTADNVDSVTSQTPAPPVDSVSSPTVIAIEDSVSSPMLQSTVDAVPRPTVHTSIVSLDPIDLPTNAQELLAFQEWSPKTFDSRLQRGEVTDVCIICIDGLALHSIDTNSKVAKNQVISERLKSNPLYDILTEFKDRFPAEVPARLPKDRGIRHEIELKPGTKYCVTRQWPLPKEQVEAIDEFFRKRQLAGQVRESKSPHSSPTFCVRKASGAWRIVHAYNKLNAATVPDQTPIPRQDQLIDSMSGCSVYSSLDLTDGYYQVLMRSSDVPLTAVSTPSGMLWEWLVMPQGLTGAPATFNRVVRTVFRPLLSSVQSYFDDLFVFSKAQPPRSDMDVHREHIRQLLLKMREADLYANLEKCTFAAPEIPVLGCFISKQGVRADPNKVKAINDWPTPKSQSDVRKWLGIANYLHRFSKNFAELAVPLTDLLRKDVPFEWTPACDRAFQAIKRSLTEAPILAQPDFERPFFVVCDASNYAIGAALLQTDADGRDRAISYQSRRLQGPERNYPVHDKELLAMRYALIKFRVYLLGSRPFTVYTDHASLRTATKSPHLSQRMARWLSFFAEYNFEVKYKPGRENVLADGLSRSPALMDGEELTSLHSVEEPRHSLLADIRASYADDDVCRAMIASLKHADTDPASQDKLPATIRSRLHRFSLDDGLLFYQNAPTDPRRIVVPANEEIRYNILYEYHDTPTAGHLGRDKTLSAVSKLFWWNNMHKFVTHMSDIVASANASSLRRARTRLSKVCRFRLTAGQASAWISSLGSPRTNKITMESWFSSAVFQKWSTWLHAGTP